MINSVEKTFPQLLIEGAEEDPNLPCLVLPNESATYGEIFKEALSIAKSLKYFGISKGDPVGILMANSVRYVESLFAISLLGALPVLYNGRFKSREISHVTKDSGIKIILTSDKADEFTNFADLLAKAIRNPKQQIHKRHLSWRIIRTSSELCCSAKRAGRFSNERHFFNKGNNFNDQDILSVTRILI